MDRRIRAQVSARRQFVEHGLGEIFNLLCEELHSADPLKLGTGEIARDEYGSPVATILPKLCECSDAEQARFVVENEMRMHYPRADLSNTDWQALAVQFWRIWGER
ncbi:MAG TPA: hypothetical protein VMU24_05120 [Candidatus Acidoferrales bacterium]|nr:hypothetical protein [Candidatus Acidoferrales bacterium]